MVSVDVSKVCQALGLSESKLLKKELHEVNVGIETVRGAMMFNWERTGEYGDTLKEEMGKLIDRKVVLVNQLAVLRGRRARGES